MDRLLLALEDSALRPVGLLWPLLTSLPLSRGIAPLVVRCVRTRAEISSGKTRLLLADPSDLPPSVPNDYRASPSLAGLPNAATASYPLPIRRIHDFVVGFLQIPPRDGHPCLDGWFRSLRSIGDSHPLNAHQYSTHQANRLPHLGSCSFHFDAEILGDFWRSESSLDMAPASAPASACATIAAVKLFLRGPLAFTLGHFSQCLAQDG